MIDPFVLLLLSAFGVGALIGGVGVGGILLIPAFAAFGGLGMREAMATALFTFIFTGIAGTFLYQRKRSIHWRITVPVCAGSLVFAFVGAWLNALTRPQTLTLLLAAVIVFAGIYTLKPSHGRSGVAFGHNLRAQLMLLVVIGAIAGLAAGWTGVGGPVLSVPLMVVFGFPALASIAASQVLQILAAASGSVGNLAFGSIDFALVAPVTAAEISGVFAGAAVAHAVDQRVLRAFVGVLCVPVGIFLGAQALGWV